MTVSAWSILTDLGKLEDGTPQRHFRRFSSSFTFFLSTTLLTSILVAQDIELASQHLRRERAKNLGWETAPGGVGRVGRRGNRTCVGQIGEWSLLSD